MAQGKHSLAVVVALTALAGASLAAQRPVAHHQGQTAEEFLNRARIRAVRWVGEGVTRPKKVTLEREGLSHFAVFKSIDVTRQGVTQFPDGTSEVNFQDSWQTEIAAYRIDRLIGLGMVPATVERRVEGEMGSLQWWIDAAMTEADRRERNIDTPDVEQWNRQTYKVRLFDQLIANVDRHMNNLLITADFDLRLIDHSRAFRMRRTLSNPENLPRFSRTLLDGIRALTRDGLKREVGRYLDDGQIDRLLLRRDAILELAKARVAEKGEAAVLY